MRDVFLPQHPVQGAEVLFDEFFEIRFPLGQLAFHLGVDFDLLGRRGKIALGHMAGQEAELGIVFVGPAQAVA